MKSTLVLTEMMQTPYYIHYSPPRMMVHKMVTSKYFDLAISAVIGLNVITMAMEFYMMPRVSATTLHEYIYMYIYIIITYVSITLIIDFFRD